MAVRKRNNPVTIFKPKQALVRHSELLRVVNVQFPKGYVQLTLSDGSIVKRPVRNYPGIAKLSMKQRQKVHVAGGESIDFDDAPEVYHVTDFIGGEIKDYG